MSECGQQSDCAVSDSQTSRADSDSIQDASNPSASYLTLKTSVDKAVSRLVSKSKYLPHFKEHLRPLYKHNCDGFIDVFKSTMNMLDSMVKEEIDFVLDSTNMQNLLSDLDLIKQADGVSNSVHNWRPSGDPKLDMAAHLQDTSEEELEHMEKLYEVMLSKNKWLNECMVKASESVSKRSSALTDLSQKWKEVETVVTDETQNEVLKIVKDTSSINFLEEKSEN